MSVIVAKQHGSYVLTGMAKLSLVMIFVAFSASFVDTIWAIYLDSFFHDVSKVGFFSGFVAVIGFISYFFLVPIVERHSKHRLYMAALSFVAISYAVFAFTKSFYLFIIFASILPIFTAIRVTCFGIIIRDKSKKNKLSRNEGLLYTFVNSAWIVGPLVAGYLSNYYGLSIIFTLAALFVIFALILFKVEHIHDGKVAKKSHDSMIRNFIDFFRNKHRVVAYVLGGGISFWWVLIYLFIPLLMIREGFDRLWVGAFLFAIAIPLVLCEYKFAKITTRIGSRKAFHIGFLSVSIIALVCFFVSNIYITLALLILASFGMAFLEPTSEAYFFNTVDGQYMRFYGPYNTAMSVNQFASKILASSLLLILPFRYLFLLFSIFMFIFFLVSFKARNVVEARKR